MRGGSRHLLVDTHLKSKKRFFPKGSIFLGGGGGLGGRHCLVVSHLQLEKGPNEAALCLRFFTIDRVPTISRGQEISPTSISYKLTQLKKSKTVLQRTEKSVKFLLSFFSLTASPKIILTIHPRTEAWLPRTRIKYLLHNTFDYRYKNFINSICK